MKSVVSVIIPIFNGINLTKKCLESLFNIFQLLFFRLPILKSLSLTMVQQMVLQSGSVIIILWYIFFTVMVVYGGAGA
jgi:hypothetical protein